METKTPQGLSLSFQHKPTPNVKEVMQRISNHVPFQNAIRQLIMENPECDLLMIDCNFLIMKDPYNE